MLGLVIAGVDLHEGMPNVAERIGQVLRPALPVRIDDAAAVAARQRTPRNAIHEPGVFVVAASY